MTHRHYLFEFPFILCNLYHFRFYWSIVTTCSFSLLKKAHAAETFNFLETTCYDEANKPMNTYRYLGVIFNSKLTWVDHIKAFVIKSKKQLVGQMYWEFYDCFDTATLRHLYIIYVWPHLEHASPLWDPNTHYLIEMLETVQRFACKIILKQWNIDYHVSLSTLDLPQLSVRWKVAKLSLFYKIVSGAAVFPSDYYVQVPCNYNLRAHSSLHTSLCRTNYLLFSFIMPRCACAEGIR